MLKFNLWMVNKHNLVITSVGINLWWLSLIRVKTTTYPTENPPFVQSSGCPADVWPLADIVRDPARQRRHQPEVPKKRDWPNLTQSKSKKAGFLILTFENWYDDYWWFCEIYFVGFSENYTWPVVSPKLCFVSCVSNGFIACLLIDLFVRFLMGF